MQNVQINNCRCIQTVAGNIKIQKINGNPRGVKALPGRFTHAATDDLAVTGGARCLMDMVKILTCMMVLNILTPVEIVWICTDGKRSGKPAVI